MNFNQLLQQYKKTLASQRIMQYNEDFIEYNLITEMIHNQTLKPLTKQFWIEICKKINKRKENCFTITYRDMYDLMKNINWQNSDIFKQNLQQLKSFQDGKIYIIICKANLNSFMNFYLKCDDRKELLNDVSNKFTIDATSGKSSASTLAGLTIGKPLLKQNIHNIFIY